MPKTIFPNKLKPGDTIRVIAPSSSAASMKPAIRKLAVKRAKEILGLTATWSSHATEKDILSSSSIKSRIQDLHEAFEDRSVKGVACVRGGYNANTLLPYINWELIKKNPKPLWGYSDITVLANAIYAKTGLVAYSAPNFSTFGIKDEKGQVEYIFDYFEACLMSDEPYEVFPSAYVGERKVAPKKNKGVIVLNEGSAEGVVVGGNLCSLNLLQGTEYMPSLKDKILFIEDDDFGGDQSPLEFERNLESLLEVPGARSIKGVVFGRFPKKTTMTTEKLVYIVSSKLALAGIPIIAGADFGHTNPMITFPVGGTARIEAKGRVVKIEIIKH